MAIVEPTTSQEQLRERIYEAVQTMYTEVAAQPGKVFHFPTGRRACEFLGYSGEELDSIPASAVESFAGVGYPFIAGAIREGDKVLDVGSGSGTDLFVAALKAGSGGQVYGVDMTEKMISKAKKNIEESGFNNLDVVKGNAEELPWSSEHFDSVTSNGVLNLVPDKTKAFSEIYRVLKKGGRLQISDIALKSRISEQCRMNPELWAECIVGAVPEDHYINLLEKAGFKEAELLERGDYFDRSPNEATKKSARQFGAISVTIRAVK